MRGISVLDVASVLRRLVSLLGESVPHIEFRFPAHCLTGNR